MVFWQCIPPGDSVSLRLGNRTGISESSSMLYTIDVDTVKADLLVMKYTVAMATIDHFSSTDQSLIPRARHADTLHPAWFAIELLDDTLGQLQPEACNRVDLNTYSPAGSWDEDAVSYVVKLGLFNGTGEREFSPDAPMTRAMFMTVLARLDGADTSDGAAWYEPGMAWAMSNGISDGTNPEGSVTREQMAAMLYRYALSKGYKTGSADLSGFTDSGSISPWAVEAFAWAVDAGIITGMTETTLEPAGSGTRAQVATMLMRFDKWIKQG